MGFCGTTVPTVAAAAAAAASAWCIFNYMLSCLVIGPRLVLFQLAGECLTASVPLQTTVPGGVFFTFICCSLLFFQRGGGGGGGEGVGYNLL